MKSSLVLLSALLTVFVRGGIGQEPQSRMAVSPGGHLSGRLIAPDVPTSPAIVPPKDLAPASLSPAVYNAERQVFDRLNAERKDRGLPTLEWNDKIAAIARYHSLNMAKGRFFSHQDQDGLLVSDRADRMGLADWTGIGENIAFVKGFRDPVSLAISTWMQSAAHRENVLAARWKESAIGVAIAEDGSYYFTQVFIVRSR